MLAENTAVFGIYRSVPQAERAVDELVAAGFMGPAISVVMQDRESAKEFAHVKDTKAPEGSGAGVAAGGVIGGTVGVLAGLGALAIPGVGPFIVVGPMMAGLAGLGIGRAVGGLVGAPVGMDIPENEAKRYGRRVKTGATLLSVHCDSSREMANAKQLLKVTGAEDVACTGERAKATATRVAKMRFSARQRRSIVAGRGA